jgi:hypothetical protein
MTKPNKATATPAVNVSDLTAKIDKERADLGDTTTALAAKADVKARVGKEVEAVKDKARVLAEDAGNQLDQVTSEANATAVALRDKIRANPAPYVLALGGAALVYVVIRKLLK